MPNEHYVLSIDQSTNVTKVMLFDEKGALFAKVERPHR